MKVMSDPQGEWVPKATTPANRAAGAVPKPLSVAPGASTGLARLLGSDSLVGTDGKSSVSLSDVVKDAPLVALYFSAHWCGPCRAFTPKLVTFVEMLQQEEGVTLPVIFGSSDRDAAA